MTFNYINSIKSIGLLGLAAIFSFSCEREISEDAVLATYDSTAEVFMDSPIGMGSDFYFPYADSKATAWSVDEDESYMGSSSMRFDVPNATDPEGGYAGAIFRIDGAGRDLSNYDALTFWAKATQGVTIGEFGLGEDFMDNKNLTTLGSVSLSTAWQKVIIPLPDPSKFKNERGMFRYAAGTQETDGSAYSFWVDELQFEKLGTIAHPRPAIQNGQDAEVQNFVGGSTQITDLTMTVNTASGDISTRITPTFFDFNSSDESVATVNANGMIDVVGAGQAIITASFSDIEAKGSVILNSSGSFEFAPTPSRAPEQVTSIFSDYYDNVPVDFFNGYWQPYQTTLSDDFVVQGDNILNYTNFNFVGNKFSNPTVDATEKSNLHLNMFIPDDIPSNLDFLITIVDFGPDQADGGGDDTRQQVFFNASDFEANTWATLEMPITMANRDNIGLIIYENINGSPLSNFYLDNIYFYSE